MLFKEIVDRQTEERWTDDGHPMIIIVDHLGPKAQVS